MIQRTQITDVVCPTCEGQDIEYNNEPAKLVGLPKEHWPEDILARPNQFVRQPGFFCFECKQVFKIAKRKPLDQVAAAKFRALMLLEASRSRGRRSESRHPSKGGHVRVNRSKALD